MTVIPLRQSGASVQHRGPGKCNIAAIRACRLADLVQGTAYNWVTSPKQIVKGIGAPVSCEYLRRALKLHPEARREVAMGWFPLVCSSDSTPTAPTAVTRLEQIVEEIGVSAVLNLLAAVATRLEIAA